MIHLNIFNYMQHSMIVTLAFVYYSSKSHSYVKNFSNYQTESDFKTLISKAMCCLLLYNYEWNHAIYVRLPIFPTISGLRMEAFCCSSLISIVRVPMNAINLFIHFTVTGVKLLLCGANLKCMADEYSWNSLASSYHTNYLLIVIFQANRTNFMDKEFVNNRGYDMI